MSLKAPNLIPLEEYHTQNVSTDKPAGESPLCSSRVSFADAEGVSSGWHVAENTGYVESLAGVKEEIG